MILLAIRYIPDDWVGVVEKRWSARGSIKGGLIALRGEAGYQPWLLRGGLHWLMPFQYRVHRMALVTIEDGPPAQRGRRRSVAPDAVSAPHHRFEPLDEGTRPRERRRSCG